VKCSQFEVFKKIFRGQIQCEGARIKMFDPSLTRINMLKSMMDIYILTYIEGYE
jgi:hypothetical protein